MTNAHDYLATIERLGAAQFADTNLSTSHAGVAHRVRVHRIARASATSVASIGVLGGGAWGTLALLDGAADSRTPGVSPSASTTPSPPEDATILEYTVVSFSTGDRLDEWVVDAALALGVDEQALLDAIATAAPGDANPEGWIKPGSYTVGPDASPAKIARSLVAQRVAQLETLGVPREQWQDVITKASLVEAETQLASDMPKVARVIQNRLDQAMPLQLESPLLYVVRPDVNLVSDDGYAVDSPYNTYMYEGLPPAAINSPSDAAVDAVLHPAAGDWLYFVVVNTDNGETLFATTFEEHAENVMVFNEWFSEQEQAG
ncbi:endolytic transglycosylase MltG [Demequina sp.]|uniref:endolytic transglycosylase MltG n=1 Tax=Demequina sp. TaxID=2050685 RepID=UPI0025C13EFF|nr:endolytic transglycosylase MltG [Demequina sp.]